MLTLPRSSSLCCSRGASLVTVLCTILAFILPTNSKLSLVHAWTVWLNYRLSFVYMTGQQCTVDTETIVSSSSSDDVCAVVSTETLSYTCTNNDNDLSWSSTVWNGTLTVVAGASPVIPMLNANGVTLMESNNNNATCLSSTLTFNGSLEDLSLLNSATLFCGILSAQCKLAQLSLYQVSPSTVSLYASVPFHACSYICIYCTHQ